MTNLRIGARLLLGFGIVVALSIAIGVFAYEKHAALLDTMQQVQLRDFVTLDRVRGIVRSEDDMRAIRLGAMLSALAPKQRTTKDIFSSEREWFRSRDENLRLLGEIEQQAGDWERASTTQARGTQWVKIRTDVRSAQGALRGLSGEVERQFDLIKSGRVMDAIADQSVENAVEVYRTRLETIQNSVHDQMDIGRTDAGNLAKDTQRSILIAIVIIAAAGLALAFLIYRSITAPLHDFMKIVEQVGRGDLTLQAPAAGRNELSDLGRSLNVMVSGLREVAAQTRSVAQNLNAATAEILASTQQQAASTAEQAASVQQANASMAEISQSGAQISDRAKEVAAAAEATSSASVAGLRSVQNTTALMQSIREQSEAVAEHVVALSEKTQAVGDIISAVNDVSEQSHLLALNAAIQAAAAGEHGRSFSVVAAEMKTLAAQSKQSTLQVRSILGDIQKAITSSVMLTEEAVKRAESGRQQAEVADRTIRELSANIEESIRALQQIVGGSAQQRIGFDQVTQAFRSIGMATQETANSTKQSEKAAANLNALAQQLRAAVEQYKL